MKAYRIWDPERDHLAWWCAGAKLADLAGRERPEIQSTGVRRALERAARKLAELPPWPPSGERYVMGLDVGSRDYSVSVFGKVTADGAFTVEDVVYGDGHRPRSGNT